MNYYDFLNMTKQEQRHMINGVENALVNCKYLPDNLYVNRNEQHIKKIIEDYVRTDEDVLEHNIDYYDIKCPIEMLDTANIIYNDNDYEEIQNGYHLYALCIENELEELIKNQTLIQVNPEEAIQLYRKHMENMWSYTSQAIDEYIGALVTYGGDSTYKIYDAMIEVLNDINNDVASTNKEDFIEAILAQEYFYIG